MTSPRPAPRAIHEAPRHGAWAHMAGTMTVRGVATVVGLALVIAIVLNGHFMTPFPVLLGRTLFIGLVLLVAFGATARWPARLPAWLPRWIVRLAAVALAAPLAALAVYLLTVRGDVRMLLGTWEMVTGYLLISGTGLVFGLVLALGALYRERDAQAQAQALGFALERETLERQAADARLALLQAQVEPHFLFNTLANVQALVEAGSPRAGPVLANLVAYLRAALPRLADGHGTLARELELLQAYLELMAVRMPDRLAWTVDVPADLRGLRFPPLGLLTLVENAVRHGLDPAEDGGSIAVGGARDAQGRVHLWVEDDGVGLDEAAPPGTGLANLRSRLNAACGPKAELILSPRVPHGLRAEIVFDPGTSA